MKTAASRQDGLAVGDYDNDGQIDFHITNFSDDSNVLFNTMEKQILQMSHFKRSWRTEHTVPRLGHKLYRL